MSADLTQLEQLQSRITAAMDRIVRGVEAIEAAPPVEAPTPEVDQGALDALNQALEDERLANAQLEERIRAIKAQQDEAAAGLEKAMAEQRAAMAQLDKDLQRLRKANQQLRDSNQALRDANQEGVGDAHLINSALMAELEALRASRASDRSEAQAIISALTPLIAGSDAGLSREDH